MLNLKKTIKICLIMMTLALENSSWGMEENPSEESKPLLNIQGQYTTPINLTAVQKLTPLPDDCWLTIFEDLQLNDCAHMSETCPYFYKMLKINENIFSKVFHYFMNVDHIINFQIQYSPLFTPNTRPLISPESERELIQKLDQLVLKNESLYQGIGNHFKSKKDSKKKKYYNDVNTLYKTLDANTIIPLKQSVHHLLAHFTTINPSIFDTPEVDSLGLWSIPPLVTPPTTWRRVCRMLSRNIPLTISLTAISITAFGTGAYLLWNQYPDVDPIMKEAGQKALAAFLNRTYLEGPPELGMIVGGVNPTPPPFFHNCLQSIFGCQYSKECLDGKGTASCFDCDDKWDVQEKVIYGNITDWVNLVTSRCGCSFDFWYRYAGLLINGTPPNANNMVCNLNQDNISICCGNVWNDNAYKEFKYPFTCFGDYSFRMIRGDGLEAKQAAEQAAFEAAVAPWKMAMRLYFGIGGPASLLFFGMMIVSYCFC